MKTKSFCKVVAVALFILILFFSLQTFAAEKGILTLEGSLMRIDLQKNMIVVCEMTFVWDKKSIFVNESGTPITPDQLKIDRMVYIEGERLSRNKPILIKELRLLSK